MPHPSVIGVTAGSHAGAKPYIEAIRRNGAEARLLLPGRYAGVDRTLGRVGALLLTGGADLGPAWYPDGGRGTATPGPATRRDEMERSLLLAALDRDIPVLCICRGMHALNLALGGSLVDGLVSHDAYRKGREDVSSHHRLYMAPGSKLASIVGSGGFVRVNSRHRQGLREPQKSPLLMASAYSLDDGLIEALESPRHDWVIGVQFHPEIRKEVPPHFERLFQGLVQRASSRSKVSQAG